jgi:hypothetical protein
VTRYLGGPWFAVATQETPFVAAADVDPPFVRASVVRQLGDSGAPVLDGLHYDCHAVA